MALRFDFRARMPLAPLACGWYGVCVVCVRGGLYASRAHGLFEIAHAPGGVEVLGVARGQVEALAARAHARTRGAFVHKHRAFLRRGGARCGAGTG